MSEFDNNVNNSFEKYRNTPNAPPKVWKNYNTNTMTIPKRYKSPIIYDPGVDNYFFNEIKKAKYQGVFDPGSIGNKNIFVDSNITNKNYTGYNNQQKIKKNSRFGEGKNLLILKSETKYPINYVNNSRSPDVNFNQRQAKNIYNFNNYYIETRNNNYRNIYARSNDNKQIYLSPSKYNNKNDYSPNNNYLTKTINIEKLNRDFNRRFNNQQKTLLEKYSTNTISFNNPIKNYSPLFAPSRNSNFINQKSMNYINSSYTNNFNNQNANEYENMNNTFNFENTNNMGIYNFNENSTDINEYNKDEKKLNYYIEQIIKRFLNHIQNFIKMRSISLLNELIDKLRRTKKNKEHNFENKTIKNISLVKNKLKNRSFYYGHNNQYNNVLKEVRTIKNSQNISLDNNKDNNDEIFLGNPKHVKTNFNTIDICERKTYKKNNINKKLVFGKKVINKKVFIGDINKLNNTYNTKKIVKNIPKGIYDKKIVNQHFNKLTIFDSNDKKDSKNLIGNQNNKDIKKFVKTPIIRKKLNFPKSAINDHKILNSGVKIIDNNYINNNNIDNELEKSDNKKDLDNNRENKSSDNENNVEDNYKIDKNDMYTISHQFEEKNENEIENYSNKNLENAINIITKVIETKEKDDKENKMKKLMKIINNKINKDNKINSEIINKYFNLLKKDKNEIVKENKNPKKLELYINLIKKTKLKRNKKLNKNLFLSDLEDNEENLDISLEKKSYKSEDECNKNEKRNKDKFRIIIKQVKLQKNINNNEAQYDNYRPKTPTKYNKNKDPLIIINNKTPKIIIKKSIKIILDKRSKNHIEHENEKKEDFDKMENHLIGNEIEDKKEIMENKENKDDENIINNKEINTKDLNFEEKEKEQEIKLDEDFSNKSLENFENNIMKSNIIENEDINYKDINENEKYDDFENLVFFLRTQLIYCFLNNKNTSDSFID